MENVRLMPFAATTMVDIVVAVKQDTPEMGIFVKTSMSVSPMLTTVQMMQFVQTLLDLTTVHAVMALLVTEFLATTLTNAPTSTIVMNMPSVSILLVIMNVTATRDTKAMERTALMLMNVKLTSFYVRLMVIAVTKRDHTIVYVIRAISK